MCVPTLSNVSELQHKLEIMRPDLSLRAPELCMQIDACEGAQNSLHCMLVGHS